MVDNVETRDCETLNEFWDCASPIGELFGGSPTDFIFRGQSDSSWLLSPRAYREEVVKKYKTGVMATMKTHVGQTFFEWSLLDSFVYYCDLRGLAIPSDSMDFREYFSHESIMRMNSINNDGWPQPRVLPLMAMAQHHGIPTRLLDWSSNAYVACYFAAVGALTEASRDADKRIAIFGFTFDPQRKSEGYRHVRVPGSTSTNLSAQGGSFILVTNSGQRGEHFATGVNLESKLSGSDRLVKLTLPSRLAAALLKRCDQFGISAASIFPGYDGVARAVLEMNVGYGLRSSKEGF